MSQKKKQGKGGQKKIGRSSRPKNQTMSLYVKGLISFETYKRRSGQKS